MVYKILILLIAFIASILSPVIVFSADKVILINGSSYEGIITGAEEDSILISSDGIIKRIPRADIELIVFSSSDIVVIKNGANLEGKVVAKNGEDVVVATAEGIKTIKNFLINKVMYNSGKSVRVTVFPVTDKFFINEQEKAILTQEKGMLFAPYLNFASYYAFLSDWREQYISEYGKKPSGGGFLIGIGAKLYITPRFQAQTGYEYFGSQKIDVKLSRPTSNFTARVSYEFYYVGAAYGFTNPNTPLTYFYGGIEIGMLTGSKGGLDSNLFSTVPAIRYTIGAEQYISKNIFLSADFAFLSADVENLKLNGLPIEGVSVDFSGITLGTKLGFRLPL